MEKAHGINYRTRRILMTTSIVIKSLFAFFLLFGFFYVIANIDMLRLYYGILMKIIDPAFEVTIQNVNQDFIMLLIVVTIVLILIFANIAYILFWTLKNKQRYFKSPNKIVVFQFVNCLSFMFMPISGIFMLIACYKSDDGLPTKVRQPKPKTKPEDEKSKKPKLSKTANAEIKKLKAQKRKGTISQEKFDKLVSKIKKNDTKNIDKK